MFDKTADPGRKLMLGAAVAVPCRGSALVVEGWQPQAGPERVLDSCFSGPVAHRAGDERERVPTPPGRAREAAAEPTHTEAVVVDAEAQTPGVVLLEDLIAP